MTRMTVGPCVHVKRKGKHLQGIFILQVEDSLARGDIDFLIDWGKAAAHFKRKPMELLTDAESVFNCVVLRSAGQRSILQHETSVQVPNPG